MLELKKITKTYEMGDQIVHALDGVDLTIEDGEFVAIIGPSGSGKSTLMNVIGCLDAPSEGRYMLNGKDVSRLRSRDLADARNRNIGFVFQRFNLLGRMSALRNVEMPARYAGMPAKERRRRAEEMLRLVGLGERMHHKPMELSGGQQQRVAIARALINQPTILLADEPTGALDTRTGREIMGLFERLHRERGITVILVTHEAEVAEYAHRVIAIRDGRIESDVRQGPRRSALTSESASEHDALEKKDAPALKRTQIEKPPPPPWSRIAVAGAVVAAAAMLVNAGLRQAAVSILGWNAFLFPWLSVLGLTAAAAVLATLVFGVITRRAENVRRAFTTVALLALLASFAPNVLNIIGVGSTGVANFRGRATAAAAPTNEANGNTSANGGADANGSRRRSGGGATWTARLPTQGLAMLMHVTTYAVAVPVLLGTLKSRRVRADKEKS
jgi:putative ABC transport system ATP-binding protein